jgi:hypothetical protein
VVAPLVVAPLVVAPLVGNRTARAGSLDTRSALLLILLLLLLLLATCPPATKSPWLPRVGGLDGKCSTSTLALSGPNRTALLEDEDGDEDEEDDDEDDEDKEEATRVSQPPPSLPPAAAKDKGDEGNEGDDEAFTLILRPLLFVPGRMPPPALPTPRPEDHTPPLLD